MPEKVQITYLLEKNQEKTDKYPKNTEILK